MLWVLINWKCCLTWPILGGRPTGSEDVGELPCQIFSLCHSILMVDFIGGNISEILKSSFFITFMHMHWLIV